MSESNFLGYLLITIGLIGMLLMGACTVVVSIFMAGASGASIFAELIPFILVFGVFYLIFHKGNKMLSADESHESRKDDESE